MRNIWLLVTALVYIFKLSAQVPEDILKVKEANEKYLEHLIKFKIDSARRHLGIKPLANDSLLYVASKFHADYLNENSKTSHTQINDSLKTPELRLNFFGAKDYMYSEMVNSIYVHRPQNINPDPNLRESIKVTLKTYEEVANYFQRQWAQDKDTKVDFQNPKFNVIGVAVAINPLNDCIKVVATFGRPFLKYQFVENKEMFPYSDYQTEAPILSFEQDKSPKILERPFKIDIADELKCLPCEYAIKGLNLKLQTSGKKVYLVADEIENQNFGKFISSSKNGFMLEVIEYEDYHNGNPSYFEKPTRRNKKYIYNGEVQAPVLGDVAKTAYNAYKASFKLQLGVEPKIKTMFEYNVYVIYKNKICSIIRFTEPVGDALALFEALKLEYNYLRKDSSAITLKDNETSSVLKIEHTKHGFELAPEKINSELQRQRKSEPSKNLSKGLLSVKYPIVSSPKDNPNTQKLEIEKLVSTFKLKFPDMPLEIETMPNVQAFSNYYATTKSSERKNYTEKQFVTLLNDPKEYELHKNLLDKSWSASIKLISYEDQKSLLLRKYTTLKERLDTAKEIQSTELEEALKIQQETFTFFNSTGEILPNEIFQTQNNLASLKPFYQNQLIYAYNSISNYTEDTLKYFYKSILGDKEKKDASLIEKKNFLKFSINHMSNQPFDFNFRSNNLTAYYNELMPEIKGKELVQIKKSMEVKLTYYYSYYNKAASLFESNLEDLYSDYKNGSAEEVYKLALTFAYYKRNVRANEIIETYTKEKGSNTEMQILYNKINQKHIDIFDRVPEAYMSSLIKSLDTLGQEKWCGQFVGKGNISFQIFDHFPLYQKYCEECKSFTNAAQLMPY